MSKRSAAVVELESHLREMVGPSGALLETRWVGRLVELMRETENTEAREYLLKVILATPQTDKTTSSRFIQLGGVELLGKWINDHRKQTEQEDKQVIHSILSCLNKLNISMETMQRTEIGKIVNGLSKHVDSSISAKAASIVSKWKKQVTGQPDDSSKSAPKIAKLVKETRPSPAQLKRPKVEERTLPMPPAEVEPLEEVYLPPKSPSPPQSPEPMETVHRLRWVEDDYLVAVKLFYRNDEPNAKCASERPLPQEDFDMEKTIMSVDDFRKREDMMTRELSKKEKQVEGQIHEQLRNMKPVVTFICPMRLLLATKKKARSETQEMKEQARRELEFVRITYQRESEIPRTPREPVGKSEANLTSDTAVIPLVNKQPRAPVEDKVASIPALYSSPGLTVPPPVALPSFPPMTDPYFQMYMSQMQPMVIGSKKRVQIDPRTNKPVNWRTVPCRMFHSPQGCTRGDNCHFIHDTNYGGKPIPNLTDWKKSNEVRQKNLKQMENVVPGAAAYYYPSGSEPHYSS